MSKYYDHSLIDQRLSVDNPLQASPQPARSPDPKPEHPDEEPIVSTPAPAPIPPIEPQPTLGATAKHQITLLYVTILRVFVRWKFEAIEMQSAITATVLGLWLLGPAQSFDNAPAFYQALERLASPIAIGGIILFLGVTQGVSLILRHWQSRRVTTLATAMLWFFLAILFAQCKLTAIAPVYAVLAAFSAWAYLRLGRLQL